MNCRNCNATGLSPQAIACPKCGVHPLTGTAYCPNCGNQTDPQAVVCVSCGVALGPMRLAIPGADKKLPAALTALLLSGLGVHKFILGYTGAGLVMLLVTVLTFGIGWIVMGPISIIEGIIYLTKSDEEFVATYVQSRKEWF